MTASGARNQIRIVARLEQHPVAAFTVITYAISWVGWLPLLADRKDWVNWSASSYLHLVGGLGPAAAAILVTAVVAGRTGMATPSTTKLIPTLMGSVITLARLAVIPSLAKIRRAELAASAQRL